MPQTVSNNDVANVLFNVATVLELAEASPYQVNAYRRAARLILRSRDDVRTHLAPNGDLDIPGLGPQLRQKLGTMIRTGRLGFEIGITSDLPAHPTGAAEQGGREEER